MICQYHCRFIIQFGIAMIFQWVIINLNVFFTIDIKIDVAVILYYVL